MLQHICCSTAVAHVKIMFEILPNNWFVSTRTNSMKYRGKIRYIPPSTTSGKRALQQCWNALLAKDARGKQNKIQRQQMRRDLQKRPTESPFCRTRLLDQSVLQQCCNTSFAGRKKIEQETTNEKRP